ncbi:hypothetical protein FACS1894190_02640 [Spirochaetia bacterium]|nr:hypothetical protein FACS1894190_02640 [Spirochaetia bacterium]
MSALRFFRKISPVWLLTLVFLIMCGSKVDDTRYPDPYYINGTKQEKEILSNLFTLLSKDNDDEERFSIVREIANEYKNSKDWARLVNFLTSWVAVHPDDPFNTYYLFMTAFGYEMQQAFPVAAMYFNLIVNNYSDLIVQGASVHLVCLKHLIDIEDKPEQKIRYYEELINRFPDDIDIGTAWFMLGRMYEEVGEWSRAIVAYRSFLPYYGNLVPGFPDAYSYAKQMVDFNNSAKNWTFESLGALVDAVKRALDNGSTWQLWQYRARVNFFARSWAQAGSDEAGIAEFNISSFGGAGKLNYADNLSNDSNANEAYLRTWGWSQFTPIWYFYFRKIYFPLDPDIHGRWEWAGVYYGEKF